MRDLSIDELDQVYGAGKKCGSKGKFGRAASHAAQSQFARAAVPSSIYISPVAFEVRACSLHREAENDAARFDAHNEIKIETPKIGEVCRKYGISDATFYK